MITQLFCSVTQLTYKRGRVDILHCVELSISMASFLAGMFQTLFTKVTPNLRGCLPEKNRTRVAF